MAYTLLYAKTAAKNIQKLDSVAKKRIKKRLEEFTKDPLVHAKKLTDPRIGTYRWRIGNYRVVFDINDQNIVILRVGHRKDIYK